MTLAALRIRVKTCGLVGYYLLRGYYVPVPFLQIDELIESLRYPCEVEDCHSRFIVKETEAAA